jgi:hypothetical protein
MTITWPNNVTLPVSLYGLIPGGTAFQLPASQSLSQTTYDWTVNVAQGTDVILLMSDNSQFQTGGSTPLLEVGQGNTGCMNDTSPSAGGTGTGSGTATSAGPSASISGVGGTSGGGGSGQGNNGGDGGGGGGNSTPTGAIVGGTLGGVAFIVLLALLLFFGLKRRARDRRSSNDSTLIKNYGMSGASTEKKNRFDILAGGGARRDAGAGGLGRSGSDAETRVGGEEYQPSPFRYPSPPPGSEGGALVPPIIGAKEAESRRSHESGNTNGTGRQSVPGHHSSPSATGTATGIGSGSQAGRTDDATVGHGVQRGASTRKTGVPPSPTVNTPRRGVEELADAPAVEEETRFVQHKDEGPIV